MGKPLSLKMCMGIGALYAFFTAVFVAMAQISLFTRWVHSLDERPDFGGNGLNWLAIAERLLLPPFDFVLIAIPFILVFPLFHRGSQDASSHVLRGLIPFVLMLTVQFLACLKVVGWEGTHVLLAMTAGPLMVISTIGAIAFVRHLARRDEEAQRWTPTSLGAPEIDGS